MPSLVTASTPKRFAAYLIDFLLLSAPVGYAIWWTIRENFTPKPLWGWVTLSCIFLLSIAVAIIYAAQNASKGQTLGKRLLGLRVLRAESLEPADFADSFARGSSFFFGLLGLGIAPVRAQLLRAHTPETQNWPHRAGNTRVIDIRRGQDPLDPTPRFYPVYPEEWHLGQPSYIVNAFPKPVLPQPLPQSFQNQPYRSTPNPLPARLKKKRRQKLASVTGSLLGTLTGICLVLFAFVYAGNLLQPAPPQASDPRETLASNLNQTLPINGYSGQGFPGYQTQASWVLEVPATARSLVSGPGVYILENRTLKIYSADSGQEVKTLEINEQVETIARTYYGDQAGIYWSAGRKAHGWFPGLEAPFSADLPENVEPIAAGNTLLFASLVPDAQGNYKAWQFGPEGFTEYKVPQGSIPGSLHLGNLISTTPGGDIRITSVDGKEITAYPLQKPQDNQNFVGVTSIGFGKIVALWSVFPDSTVPDNPITIGIYDAQSGELQSYMTTSRQRILEDSEFIWGDDGSWARFALYGFDLVEGKPLVDLKANGITPNQVIGQGIVGENAQGIVYLTEQSVESIARVTPLAITPDYAIIEKNSQTIEKYSAQTEETHE